MRGDAPANGPERVLLAGFLDHLRASLETSAHGLTDEQLHRRHPDVRISMGSLLSHLAFQEDYWFGHVWAGRPPSEPWRSGDWGSGDDLDWRLAGELDGAQLRELWSEAVERARDEQESGDLDDATPRPVAGAPVSRRWVMLHMIEEYARHCGHADVLRAALDDVVLADRWRHPA